MSTVTGYHLRKISLNSRHFMKYLVLYTDDEVEGVGRRRTQLLDDLRNRKRYWELKVEAEDRKRWSLWLNSLLLDVSPPSMCENLQERSLGREFSHRPCPPIPDNRDLHKADRDSVYNKYSSPKTLLYIIVS